MNIESLIAASGGSPKHLAAYLDVALQTVYNWKNRGIPEVRQVWIQAKAPALVKAAQDGLRAPPVTDQPQSAR